jgi:hypothetical protein
VERVGDDRKARKPGRGCEPGFRVLCRDAQLGWRLEPTLLNVWLEADPMAVMAAMHTTTMRASMTAYSTAVGPSSRFRNSTTLFRVLFTSISGGEVCD